MINNIIAAYLQNNKRLVVPEFGAFIRKDGGEIVFVEFLKKDDQILSSLIRQEYSLDNTEVREVISQYILNVKKTIGASGRYIIERVGTLVTDPNGLYALQYDPLARNESQQMPHIVAEEQLPNPEPQFKVVSISEQEVIPSVSDDLIADAIGGTQDYKAEGSNETFTTSSDDKTIEFVLRDSVAATTPIEPKPEKKQFTLNDLYSIPSEPSTVQHESKPTEPRPIQQAKPRHNGAPIDSTPNTQRSRPANYRKTKKNKTDIVMIIAIIAAVIAIGSLIYGITVNNDPIVNLKSTNPQTEQVENTPDPGAAEGLPATE